MARSTFRFEGSKELDAALSEFAKPVQKAVARRALQKAAAPILSAWKAGTTVGTDHLRTSETTGADSKLNRRQKRMQKRLGKSEVQVHVGTTDPAGYLEEFGSIHNAPNAALSAAWEKEGGQAAVDRIGDELGRDIAKTTKRLARKAAKG